MSEMRQCLLCKHEFPAAQEECPHCEPLVPVDPAGHRPDLHYGVDTSMFGLKTGIALVVIGILAFAGMWIAGWIWPWALIVSGIGAAMIPAGLRAKRQQDEARRRLAERRREKRAGRARHVR